ncbi:putative protein CXorf58 [Chytridiales sp. JEL 0842]|nr:putative protein CXorf58 [Chytridiales sp. JEL 0842]
MTDRYYEGRQVTGLMDVTNEMDYVNYMNSLDLLPAHLGGRNNGWRELSLSTVPNHVLYDPKWKPGIGFRQRKVLHELKFVSRTSKTREHKQIKKVDEKILQAKNVVGIEEDDFGNLFEWANMLSTEDLHDFRIV